VLGGDGGFGAQVALGDVEVGDLVGKVFGLDGDRGQEIGEGAALGDAEFVFHRLRGAAAKEGEIALAADAGETFVVAQAVEDDAGELFFGAGKFLAGADALGLGQSLLNQLLLAGLDSEVSLGKGDGVLGRVAVLRD